MRKASISIDQNVAGILWQDDSGYHFRYDTVYLRKHTKPVSLTLPITTEIYSSKVLFPFFDGLIPEGWLLDIAQRNWKLNTRDRMGLLLTCCRDCIGSISVEEIHEAEV